MSSRFRNSDYGVAGFTYWLATYGRIGKQYRIELRIPGSGFIWKFYSRESKPLYKPLIFLSILWSPVAAVVYLLFGILYSAMVFFSFFEVTLFKRSFISNTSEVISGIVSFIFFLIGIFYSLKLIFHF